MRFGLLGPVQVWHEGRSLALGTARERFVLALLLLNADRLVPYSGLIDSLWPEPPPTAKAQVHNMISRLRRRLSAGDGELIATNAGGYELRLGAHELDLVQFRHLVTTGRRAAQENDHRVAAALLGEALSLWRGDPLSEIAAELAGPVRQALHDERVAAVEAALDAELALGHHEEVLRQLPGPLAEHPYRERLYELKMASLVGAGRRADALATYREAHRRFVDDLGLVPGPSLRRLEQEILRDEPEVPSLAGRPTPRQLPPVPVVVTGRDKLVGEISAMLRQPRSAVPPVAVLVGPGGVGKSTLALAVANELTGSYPDGHLYADLRGTQDTAADPLDIAGLFLRSMGVDGSAVPADPDERIALYRSHLAGRRMVVVLDDAAREEQVRPLLSGPGGCATLVTSRGQLGGLLGAARWTVPVLAPDAALALLATILGAERVTAEQDAGREIVALCGHLPLAVCVVAARLAMRPDWTLARFRRRLSAERTRLDELAVGDLDVRASIALSYRALDPAARTLLRRLGLFARGDWPAWVAGVLEDPPRHEVIDRLVDTHLVEPLGRDPAGQDRFQLHDLVADFARERALAEDGQAGRERALTRLASAWLALATDADERLEHGMMSASGLPAPPPPAGVAVASGNPAGWFEIERANLVTAVEQTSSVGAAELAGTLALRTAGFLALRSYDRDCDHMLSAALDCARGAGDDRMLVRLLGAMFTVRAQRNRLAELSAIAEQELAVARRLGDAHHECGALIHCGRAARLVGRLAEAADRLAEAMRKARHIGLTGRPLNRLLYARANVLFDIGQPARALPLWEEALAAQRNAGDGRSTAIYLHAYGSTLVELGRLDDAEPVLAEALTLSRRLGDDRGTAWVEHALADLDIRSGRWPRATFRLQAALRGHEQVGEQQGVASALRSRGDLAAGEGRPDSAVEPLRRSLAIWSRLGAPVERARTLARLERALLATGDRDGAAACRRENQALLATLAMDEDQLCLPPMWQLEPDGS